MTERMTAKQFNATKPRKKRVDREGPIQKEIVEWLRETFPDALVHHCKNEIKKSGWQFAKELARAKELGMVPGFPDVIFLIFYPKFPAMFFEVKAEGNSATEEQEKVHAKIGSLNHRVAVVRSVEDVRECLAEWGVGYAVKLPLRGQIGEVSK